MYFAKFVAAAIVASSALVASAEPAPAPVIKQAPAGAPQLPTLTPQQLAAPPPNRIVRTPLTLQARTLTNRVLIKSSVVNLINRGVTLQLKPVAPPGKRALVVILENGGIMNNVDPALRQALNVNIKSVTCGNFEFELRPGESLPNLIARVYDQIVSNLNCVNPANWREQVFNPLTWLNQTTDNALENAVKAQNSLLNTQAYYDQVVVMEDADAVPDKVIAAMRSLAPTHVMDVHVLTHGGQEFFVGHNNASFTSANFFQPLKADTDAKRMYVRAVYQMNCFSSTLKDDWISLGAISVNGTASATLNNMPQQYFHWLQRWLVSVQGMGNASDGSFNDAAAYSRPIYSIVGKGNLVDVSHLTATGRSANANVNAPM